MKKNILAVTPVVLAGGKSTRMGQDKSFVQLAGKPMIEVVLMKLAGIFSLPPIIITNSPEQYDYLGVRVEPDLIQGSGPLGGIQAGLYYSPSPYSFVTGCDMPLLNREFVHYILSQESGYDVVIPEYNTHLHPLHALYSRGCAKAIEARLARKERKVISFLADVKVRYIQTAEIEQIPFGSQSLVNVNTQDDLAEVQQMMQNRS